MNSREVTTHRYGGSSVMLSTRLGWGAERRSGDAYAVNNAVAIGCRDPHRKCRNGRRGSSSIPDVRSPKREPHSQPLRASRKYNFLKYGRAGSLDLGEEKRSAPSARRQPFNGKVGPCGILQNSRRNRCTAAPARDVGLGNLRASRVSAPHTFSLSLCLMCFPYFD